MLISSLRSDRPRASCRRRSTASPRRTRPVLHLDALAAAKTGALFGRAQVRDAIDIGVLLRAGYSRARLLELAARNEAEPNLSEYASALTPQTAAAIRRRFDQPQLTLPGNQAPTGSSVIPRR
ncbi:nucleotidyl transferase AbiEii/AbiGii toxin family protein [Streptomyces sp. NPDC060031]|uniref:nucleotidyl transferase AbiEii/AbiGii toxin family protein n=1 Tax=Streptomyces sp. NPDC060031 TaxID=3347043 RepID=UPI0036AD0423